MIEHTVAINMSKSSTIAEMVDAFFQGVLKYSCLKIAMYLL